MNRIVTAIALTGVTFFGTQALAVDSTSQSTMNKRQMIVQMVGCMRKRMSANKSSSYNEAKKACKDQINRESDNSPSGALVASDAPAKP
jgi:pectin methylesterase-like acyl-CoA thioesterase